MQGLVCQYAYYGQCGYLNGLDGVGSCVLMLDDHGKLAEDGRLECAAISAIYFLKKN
jgi:hypothetical protein